MPDRRETMTKQEQFEWYIEERTREMKQLKRLGRNPRWINQLRDEIKYYKKCLRMEKGDK